GNYIIIIPILAAFLGTLVYGIVKEKLPH
ncbi:MAG TPA: YeeE/YedE family protein, partial [Vicingus sp.]|nr:YeeE/YedE family protein [Vicingus sp.]